MHYREVPLSLRQRANPALRHFRSVSCAWVSLRKRPTGVALLRSIGPGRFSIVYVQLQSLMYELF